MPAAQARAVASHLIDSSQVATKADLDKLQREMAQDLGKLQREMAQDLGKSQREMAQDLGELRREMYQLERRVDDKLGNLIRWQFGITLTILSVGAALFIGMFTLMS